MYNFKKLDEYIKSLEHVGIPFCGLEVRHHHNVVYRSFQNFSVEEKARGTNENSIVWLFSTTKIITCICSMRLVEEGKIGLDDAVSKYLPEFADIKVKTKDGLRDANTVMLVRHLFSMSAGLNYSISSPSLMTARENKNATTRELVRAVANEPLEFDPGTNYRYSLCHDVLAAIIEVVSGMTFAEYLKKFIFDPLEIKNMGFFPDESVKSRFAGQYSYDNAFYTSVLRDTVNSFTLSDKYESGGAGLYSNLLDYVKIIDAVACGGVAKNGYRILRPETVALMEENQLCKAGLNTFHDSPRQHGYGWGLCGRVHMDPAISLSYSPAGEFGWDGAAACFTFMDRKNEIAVFFETHVFGCGYAYERIHPHIRDLVYDAIK